ncbi:replication initiation protein [Campylobacter sp.]|uniref:replication initiation protein n=1 Tax=Campylobacter sp. TaxID=205 RepID=UPI00259CF305|nr:replication initiation protein [Campylobacter sp.]MBQ3166715.1 replication initiation protein [Campylobacter sp.]
MPNITLGFRFKDYKLRIEVEKGDLSYANEMNMTLSFPDSFTASDFNMFFTLCYFIKKDRFNNKVEIPFSALESFLPNDIKDKKRFHESVVKFANKIKYVSETYTIKTIEEEVYGLDAFFTSIKAYRNKQILSLEVNKKAKEFLFSFSRYLYFNLHEFCGIKSKYSKSVFRILIQFKNVKSNFKGEKELTLTKKQFRNLLSIPKKYKSTEVDRLVLKPSSSELSDGYFNKVNFVKEFSDSNDIIAYKIIFDDSNRK